ncbi:hypothetical protein CWI39_0031p0050 [Hamiltosporidium magnivora]|uniref:Uncharacterized protein n=1 Tax=Hamiltosporidium magnivora TaxID=148818 RepID=A0A4V2JWZ3_9MICR|nr:hypothetical protein CWI39_0031p0050 [Hamiltosporidium magnivora]
MYFSIMNQELIGREDDLSTYDQVCGNTPATETTLHSGSEDDRLAYMELGIFSRGTQMNLELAVEPRNTEILTPPENPSFSDEVVSWFNLYLSKILYFSYIFVSIELINLNVYTMLVYLIS